MLEFITQVFELNLYKTRRLQQLTDEAEIHEKLRPLTKKCPEAVAILLLFRAYKNRKLFNTSSKASLLNIAGVVDDNMKWIDTHQQVVNSLLDGDDPCKNIKNHYRL